MAITYRGQASRLNKIESKQNASGFQEKSDPGPRQGVGGEDVSLKQAKASFQERLSSPGKKKNFYGGYSARTKQIEIIGELQYRCYDQNINKSGILKISKFMPANEINPSAEIMAQKELIGELELTLLEELMQEYWLIEA